MRSPWEPGQRPLRILFDGGLALPGEAVTPIAIVASTGYLDDLRGLGLLRKGLKLSLADNLGKRFQIGEPVIVYGSSVKYAVKDWGDIWLNRPGYELTLSADLEHEGETYSAKQTFRCYRGSGEEVPMRADTPHQK